MAGKATRALGPHSAPLSAAIDRHVLMEARIRSIERWLTPRHARFALVTLALLSLAFGLALRDVRLDHDFERFFPTDDPELDRYLSFRERFGGDDDFLLIGAAHSPSVFDSAFLARFDALADALSEADHVRKVTAITNSEEPRLTPVGLFAVPCSAGKRIASESRQRARVERSVAARGPFRARRRSHAHGAAR